MGFRGLAGVCIPGRRPIDEFTNVLFIIMQCQTVNVHILVAVPPRFSEREEDGSLIGEGRRARQLQLERAFFVCWLHSLPVPFVHTGQAVLRQSVVYHRQA